MTWIYIQGGPLMWKVGFYDPSGRFHFDTQYMTRREAAERVHFLNGGMP